MPNAQPQKKDSGHGGTEQAVRQLDEMKTSIIETLSAKFDASFRQLEKALREKVDNELKEIKKREAEPRATQNPPFYPQGAEWLAGFSAEKRGELQNKLQELECLAKDLGAPLELPEGDCEAQEVKKPLVTQR